MSQFNAYDKNEDFVERLVTESKNSSIILSREISIKDI
jgi:hypothetical protein